MLSSLLLNERLNIHGKLGCLLAIIGSTVVVLHSPESAGIHDFSEIGRNMLSPGLSACHQVCLPVTRFVYLSL